MSLEQVAGIPGSTRWRMPSGVLAGSVVLLALGLLLWGEVRPSAQSIAALGRSFPGSPAFSYDADGAVGPSHYAEITNLGFRVVELSAGAVVHNSTSLSAFWNGKVGLPLGVGCCFDPHLEYDHASQRWFAVSLAGGGRPDSSLYLGVSDSPDPSGGWKGLVLEADVSNLRWADFPYLGLDGLAVYITVGMPSLVSPTQSGQALLVLPKADLTASRPTAARLSRFFTVFPTTVANDFHYNAQPQIDYLGSATDGLLLAAFYQPAFVDNRWTVNALYQRMSGQASGTVTLLPWGTTPAYRFDSTANPIPRPSPSDYGRQPGTTHRVNNGNGNSNVRIGDAVYSVSSAPVAGRLGIVWRRFQPSTNTVVDAGFIGDEVHDYLTPSIAANANGDIVIAYARTSPIEYVSFYGQAGQPDASGKVVLGPPMLVKAGSDVFDEHAPVKSPGLARLVDYASSVSVHPWDHSRFWISGPYVSGRNRGSTWIAEVILPPAGSGGGGVGAAPANLVPTVSGSTVDFRWNAATGGPTPTGYVVEASLTPGGVVIASVNSATTSLTLTHVPPGFYFVQVRAIYPGGVSQPSTPVQLIVGSAGASMVLTVTPPSARIGEQVTFSWTDQVLGSGNNYTLFVAGPGTSTFSPLVFVPCCAFQTNIPPTQPGTYSFYVRGTNAVQSNTVTLDVSP